jgi:hypothetical protein
MAIATDPNSAALSKQPESFIGFTRMTVSS